jgi:hypothetical protein
VRPADLDALARLRRSRVAERNPAPMHSPDSCGLAALAEAIAALACDVIDI